MYMLRLPTKEKVYLLLDVRGGHTKLLKKKKNGRTTTQTIDKEVGGLQTFYMFFTAFYI